MAEILIRKLLNLNVEFETHEDLLEYDKYFLDLEEILKKHEERLKNSSKDSYILFRTSPYSYLIIYQDAKKQKLRIYHLNNKKPKYIDENIKCNKLNITSFDFIEFKKRCATLGTTDAKRFQDDHIKKMIYLVYYI